MRFPNVQMLYHCNFEAIQIPSTCICNVIFLLMSRRWCKQNTVPMTTRTVAPLEVEGDAARGVDTQRHAFSWAYIVPH